MIPLSCGAYRSFHPTDGETVSSRGFDIWAEEYGRLPVANPVFRLSKELLYTLYLKEVHPRLQQFPPPLRMLDFNCGPGNDFAFFLDQGYEVTGCDGSPGMLQVAWKKFQGECRSGRLKLFLGRAECLQPDSFEGRRFHLIFSTTGGFSYLDDRAFIQAHRALYRMLVPGGVLMTAHLTPFCLPETVYFLLTGHPRRAFRRWRGRLRVNIRGKPQRMWLRSSFRVFRLLHRLPGQRKIRPALCLVPPFQTGFQINGFALSILYRLEKWVMPHPAFSLLADQVVIMLWKPGRRRSP